MKKEYSIRKLLIDIHLWLGLPSALILFIMCLTGTLYVFQKEITQWADSETYHIQVPADGRRLPVAQIQTLLEKEKNGNITNILIPEFADEAWTFTLAAQVKTGEDTQNKSGGSPNAKTEIKKEKTKSYWVNPYTGKIISDAQTPTAAFFATVLKLHRWLLIENHDIGGTITGTAALMMLLLQITGLMLWAPAKLKSWKKFSAWKAGFKIKTDAKFKRVNFDLHKALGFYAFVFVTLMALTGPYFVFNWYKTAFAASLGTKPLSKEIRERSVIPAEETDPVAFEKILSKIDAAYPYPGTVKIAWPKDTAGTYAVQKYRSGFITSAAVDKMILDQYSGGTLSVSRFADKNLGEKIVASAKLIHTGELFGTFSKIIYLVACLIATSLPVTGFLIWWGKNKKAGRKEHTAKRQKTSVPLTA